MFKYLLGFLMDEAGGGDGGGGGGGAAVADAGAGISSDTGSTALTTTESTDLATTDTGTDDTTDASAETSIEPFRTFENGRLTPKAVQALQPLKGASPQLYREIQGALAVRSRLRSMFPPNVNAFDAIKGYQRVLKELGGDAGIADIRGQLAEMEELDLLYSGADPRMLDQMTTTPEGKASFAKLAPAMLDKLEQLAELDKRPEQRPAIPSASIAKMAPKFFSLYETAAPNTWTAHIAGIMYNYMIQKNLDVVFRRMVSMLPADNAEATSAAGEIQGFFNELVKFKNLPPDRFEVQESRVDPRENQLTEERQRLESERQQIKRDAWVGASRGDGERIFARVLADQTKGKKIDAVAKENIDTRARMRLKHALDNVPGLKDAVKEYFQNNDREGYMRYLRSVYEEHTPRVVKTEVDRELRVADKPAAKGATATATATARTQPVEKGFKRVAEKPAFSEWKKGPGGTTPEMLMKKQAVLKNGTMVTWG